MTLPGAPARLRCPAPEPLDLARTLVPLRHGRYDPAVRIARDGVWLARRTAAGPATLRLDVEDGELLAEAWGPGAELALAAAPGLAGLLDDPAALVARHPIVAELVRHFPGLRLPRSGDLFGALVPAVLEQKVTGAEAHRAYAAILRRLGEPAPGPVELVVPPAPERLARLPSYAYHPLGVERRRAELLQRIARSAARLAALEAMPGPDARVALQAIPGIGAWTAAESTRIAHGDPDAVSVGDAHIPSVVSWALAGEPRADDERMLDLLEPYRGQRARVVRLLEAAGITEPRYGPRMSPRRIDRI